EVLARDGDSHPEDRLHEQAVRARRPRAVDVGQLEREVVGPDHLLLMHAITPAFAPLLAPLSAGPARAAPCPRPPSGSARRTARSGRRRPRPSPSPARSAAARPTRTAAG